MGAEQLLAPEALVAAWVANPWNWLGAALLISNPCGIFAWAWIGRTMQLACTSVHLACAPPEMESRLLFMLLRIVVGQRSQQPDAPAARCYWLAMSAAVLRMNWGDPRAVPCAIIVGLCGAHGALAVLHYMACLCRAAVTSDEVQQSHCKAEPASPPATPTRRSDSDDQSDAQENEADDCSQ